MHDLFFDTRLSLFFLPLTVWVYLHSRLNSRLRVLTQLGHVKTAQQLTIYMQHYGDWYTGH